MGTSGGPGKIDSLNYGGDLSQLANAFRKRSGEMYRTAAPLYKEQVGQTLEALRTGGINAQIPTIQRAVEASRMATDQATRNASDQMATAGLAGTPFGERITAGIRSGGDIQSSQIPTQIIQAILGQAPGLSAQGFGASGQFGGLSSNTLGNLQQMDLQRQLANAAQFQAFMEKIQETAMQSAMMGMKCLAPTALIACPGRMTQAAHLRAGDLVLSMDDVGAVVPAKIVGRQTVEIPPTHRFAIVDGNYVSPSHPCANGAPVADFGLVSAETLGLTYTVDFLIDSPTGLYRVGDVWLGSTMDARHQRAA